MKAEKNLMAQETKNVWKAGTVINAENGYVSLIRPERSSTPAIPEQSPDGYAPAATPSPLISRGDRPNNPVLASNPFRKLPNA